MQVNLPCSAAQPAPDLGTTPPRTQTMCTSARTSYVAASRPIAPLRAALLMQIKDGISTTFNTNPGEGLTARCVMIHSNLILRCDSRRVRASAHRGSGEPLSLRVATVLVGALSLTFWGFVVLVLGLRCACCSLSLRRARCAEDFRTLFWRLRTVSRPHECFLAPDRINVAGLAKEQRS